MFDLGEQPAGRGEEGGCFPVGLLTCWLLLPEWMDPFPAAAVGLDQLHALSSVLLAPFI